MAATREDADLMVHILQWGSTMGVEEALSKVFSDDFNPDTASENEPHVRKVLYFGETIGTFVKQGVLDRDLVLDLFAIGFSWKRVKPAALRVRERTGEPRMYENYEALANASLGAAVGV